MCFSVSAIIPWILGRAHKVTALSVRLSYSFIKLAVLLSDTIKMNRRDFFLTQQVWWPLSTGRMKTTLPTMELDLALHLKQTCIIWIFSSLTKCQLTSWRKFVAYRVSWLRQHCSTNEKTLLQIVNWSVLATSQTMSQQRSDDISEHTLTNLAPAKSCCFAAIWNFYSIVMLCSSTLPGFSGRPPRAVNRKIYTLGK